MTFMNLYDGVCLSDTTGYHLWRSLESISPGCDSRKRARDEALQSEASVADGMYKTDLIPIRTVFFYGMFAAVCS